MHQQHNKKRKLLFLLPLFVAPLVGLAVLFFGGGANDGKGDLQSENAFNANLPSAHVKEGGQNKLELYMQAQKDSAEQREALLANPFAKGGYDPAPPLEQQQQQLEQSRSTLATPGADANEKKVTERLDRLYKEINRPAEPKKGAPSPGIGTNPLPDDQIHELESLLTSMQTSGSTQDPEMNRIEGVLEKLLDIQHPERVKERSAKKSTTKSVVNSVRTEKAAERETGSGFFGFQEDATVTAAQEKSTVLAVVHEDQVVQDGATIKLRLLQGVFVGDEYIPKGAFVAGRCQFSGDRVDVSIKDITYRTRIYPVALTVYDTDGLAGISVPGTMARDAAKNGIGQTIQDLDVYTGNPSAGAQAASTGLQAAKSLLSKKVKAVKATIKAGHQLLLRMTTNQ